MAGEKKYLFGPVPSRRLGRSLGVDIVPPKTCTMDCVYCQLGPGGKKTIERKDYVPIDDVLSQLKDRIAQGINADYITISGSGEPTLHCHLGQLIEGIKKLTDIPVAVLTNGTLLYDPSVRADCAKADLVLPSLDAGDEQTFQKINLPHTDITFQKLIDGLCAFRAEFKGQIWLEVFFCQGINTNQEQVEKIRKVAEKIKPDKIQINTAVRPTAEKEIAPVDQQELTRIAEKLGKNAEVVADFPPHIQYSADISTRAEDILEMLSRRPCTLDDICLGLGLVPNHAQKYINYLVENKKIISEYKNNKLFFNIP